MVNKREKLMERLIELQTQYIELLQDECGATNVIAFIHGWKAEPENVATGKRIGKEIEKLRTEIK